MSFILSFIFKFLLCVFIVLFSVINLVSLFHGGLLGKAWRLLDGYIGVAIVLTLFWAALLTLCTLLYGFKIIQKHGHQGMKN